MGRRAYAIPWIESYSRAFKVHQPDTSRAERATPRPLRPPTANTLISILLILLFTATYSTTGGLRSVINTDVVQLGLAMVGTAVYALVVVYAAGGLGGLTDRIVELSRARSCSSPGSTSCCRPASAA